MRAPSRSLAALLIASLAWPAGVFARSPRGSQEAPASVSAGLAGAWEGWADLTSDWPGLSCRYEGSPTTSSVHLELTGDAGGLRGSVAIDLPPEQGSGCPPLRKRYTIGEVAAGAETASFTDSGGNEWTLSLRRSGSVLQGMLAWQAGGPEQPLADGFSRPDGVRPMTRLSGEVRVVRTDAGTTAASAPAAGANAEPAAARAKAKGSGVGGVAAVIGANVVGLGLLYGANRLGKGSSAAGVLTCSPRVCIVGAPNAPCFCDSSSNVVYGASCGNTTGGAQLNQACDGTTTPCQTGLSCNSNVCEDKFGRCPY